MKIAFGKNLENGAVVLTTTICTFALMSFLVVGYLWMMMEQNKATERSQHWNAALTVAEAGIDEGMAHINYTFNSFGTNVNFGVDGWTSNAAYFGPMSRPLSNDVGSSYTVYISNTIPPIITSIAKITDKMNSVPIQRAVQVTTMPAYVTLPPLTVRTNFTLDGGRAVINSDVGMIYGTVAMVGNGTVTGEIKTGPQASQPVVRQGSDGGWTNNFYVSLPDVEPPYTFGMTPPANQNATLAPNTEYYINGNYSPASLTIENGSNTVLYVTGNFSVNSITIQPQGSFVLYVGSTNLSTATTATFGQTSGDKINPSPGTPEQFSYFGLPNNTGLTFKNGLVSVSGSFYAPEADLSMIGNMSFFGGLVCNSYSANGNVVFNHDPKLKTASVVLAYAVASWKEIPPP